MFLGTLTMIYLLDVLSDDYNFAADLVTNKTFFVLLVTIYPLIDLLRVFILRIKNGQSPFVADNRHLHHAVVRKFKNHFVGILLILSVELTLLIVLRNVF